MRRWTEAVLARYGEKAAVETAAGRIETRAFLQPMRQRREQAPDTATEIGWVDGRLWRYLGQAALEPGDTVRWNGMAFRVRSSRPYYAGGVLNHWWASLEREREAAE